MTKYLRVKDILDIHRVVEEKYKIDDDILFPNNLESAVDFPKRNLFDVPIYSSVHEKAAALMCYLIKLHPFLDGNKRTGLLAALLFLELNGKKLQRNIDEEVKVSQETAKCVMNCEQIAEWIRLTSRDK